MKNTMRSKHIENPPLSRGIFYHAFAHFASTNLAVPQDHHRTLLHLCLPELYATAAVGWNQYASAGASCAFCSGPLKKAAGCVATQPLTMESNSFDLLKLERLDARRQTAYNNEVL